MYSLINFNSITISDPSGLADELRSKVKAVWKCDISERENIIEVGINMPMFDIVMSNLTLEAACTNIEAYAEGIGKLINCLNPKGHLVMIGVLEQTYCRNSTYSNSKQTHVHFNTRFDEMPF